MRRIHQMDPIPQTILIHGDYNAGKTYIAGAAIEHEKKEGRCIFIQIGNEPTNPTLANFDLEDVEIYHTEASDDIVTFCQELDHAHMIVLDSLASLADVVINKVTGGQRAPGEAKDGRREWGQIKFHFKRPLRQLMSRCDLFLATCPSSKRENELTQAVRIVPDLVGRNSEDIAGEFAYVGYLSALTINANKVNRALSFAPSIEVLTRCNVKHPITSPITLPEGPSVWPTVKNALERAMD